MTLFTGGWGVVIIGKGRNPSSDMRGKGDVGRRGARAHNHGGGTCYTGGTDTAPPSRTK